MADAGYNSTVKVTGASVAFTGEAMTGSGAGPYTITDSTKAIWNPDEPLTFYDGVTPIDTADIVSIDYFFGKVTFNFTPVGAVTVDGESLPTYSLACGREFSIDFMADLLDVTCFATTGIRLREQGLKDISGTVGFLDLIDDDLIPGPGSMTLYEILEDGVPKVLEIRPGPNGSVHRFRAIFESEDESAAVDGLVEGSFAWKIATTISQEGFAVSYGTGS